MFVPKALLFDLDGVLIDSEPLHGEAWKRTASTFKTTLSKDQLQNLQGRRRLDCAKQVSYWIKEDVKIEKILEIHKPISKGLLKNSTPMKGAEELVRWCSKNKLPICLVTSSSEKSFLNKTFSHDWIGYFSVKVFGDDENLELGKPYPDPYQLGAKKLGVSPNECWAIEDSISGVTSAFEAGCQVLVLNNNLGDFIEKKNLDREKYPLKKIDQLSDVTFLIQNQKDIFY